MTLQQLLEVLPVEQHNLARRRYKWMEQQGWRAIGLWTGLEHEAEVSDLVGIPPGEKTIKFLVHTMEDYPKE